MKWDLKQWQRSRSTTSKHKLWGFLCSRSSFKGKRDRWLAGLRYQGSNSPSWIFTNESVNYALLCFLPTFFLWNPSFKVAVTNFCHPGYCSYNRRRHIGQYGTHFSVLLLLIKMRRTTRTTRTTQQHQHPGRHLKIFYFYPFYSRGVSLGLLEFEPMSPNSECHLQLLSESSGDPRHRGRGSRWTDNL